ncbi:transcription factor HES-5-like protein [Labeo rohita]|uniref:Transcription factor HES-5 n=2 Tax=Labeo rohita TaxID=84645 RepID=A0A498L2K0_LABRO|nr:transcription factor HES-5-like protein [Labeo rohita]RXN22370.1 transcription factor HES-5-like protein [Labeo rohita]
MAPHSVTLSSFDHLHFSDKDKMKLRKPIVEKMRRDRINSCIDQLKSLLEKEFHSHDPSAKLEKADILEMTVSFLKQQRQQQQLPQRDYNEGYSHCWRESVHFLTLHSTGGGSGRELQHLHNAQRTSAAIGSAPPAPSSKLSMAGLEQPDSRRPVWRPW